MGNKLGRRKQVVEEKYTKPQGLYEIKDIDYKKLRKLILDSKLAPCYTGLVDDDFDYDTTLLPLEECPICFLYYPTLNRSRCCTKSICTECFLQMKNPSSPRPTQCPFCKTSNYAVEYRGVKSKEEKGIEQIEEQKVIEAKIRMQKEQHQEEEERQQRKEGRSSFRGSSMTLNPSYGVSGVLEHMDVSPAQDPSRIQMLRQARNTGLYRDDEFDVDFEDIMVMEAIWLSIQENGRAGPSSSTDAVSDSDMDIAPIAMPSPPLSTRAESDSGDFFGVLPPHPPPPYSGDGGFQDGLISTPIIPEGFDEQMMLAMAVSIAEAGARTPAQGVAWP